MTELLEVFLAGRLIGTLTLLPGECTFFSFLSSYLDDPERPVLSQSFFGRTGEVMPETRVVKTKVPPFFSNLLPEGHLRTYLAARGGIHPTREFKLLGLLGEDLPGAVSVGWSAQEAKDRLPAVDHGRHRDEAPYHFSLAGVQLKFSAMTESRGGLTIPASGTGGNWIVKLPSQQFPEVPENEWAMLYFAGKIGINVPETRLIPIEDIAGLPDLGIMTGKTALAVKRFDRRDTGERIHIEDFAQVYNLFPDEKYSRVNYTNIANMVWMLTGEAGLAEYVRRLVFNILIGNGDMHLKNWSYVYVDGRTPQLAPGYDFVATVPYLPGDKLALNLSGTKIMQEVSESHFVDLIAKARVPEHLVIKTLRETVKTTTAIWQQEKKLLPLSPEIIDRIDGHMRGLELVR